jgi:hypothetical protein
MGKRRRNPFKRKSNFRETLKRFLIVCEGEKTEPQYFMGFRAPKNVFDIDVKGVGANTVSLVERTIEIKHADKKYDFVWCVFDRDSFPASNFNDALALARSNGINVAYSNQAFEIWYLLHFHYHDAATDRTEYKRMLTERLGFEYKKNSPHMYDHLLALQETAIKNADKLLDSYLDHSPERDNPSTTVHRLVNELNKQTIK